MQIDWDLDWKTTWQANLIEDYHQTRYFASRGIDELNPLWSEMVKRKDYTMIAASWATSAALFDQFARKDPKLYRIAGVLQLVVTGLNAKRHRVGLPVLVVRF